MSSLALKFPFEVRISVHGIIPLTEQERIIKDARVFQRLRRISQLARTDLVYPSATHTRFEHSLGAMHVAWRIAETLKLTTEVQRIVRLAALLHDVGHGPFSHVTENVVDALTGLEKTHEYYGGAIVLYDPELAALIRAKDRREICRLIVPVQTGDVKFPFRIEYLKNRTLTKDIVSGPADGDKMDYLLRDSHHCGVKYGEFDLAKVVSSATIIRSAGVEQLGFNEDAVWVIEQMLLARHHMHRQVYGHPTRSVTDAMLVRSFGWAIQNRRVDRRDFDWGLWKNRPQQFLTRYLAWDDESLMKRLETGQGLGRDLASRLTSRNLLKEAFRGELREIVAQNQLPPELIGQVLDKRVFTQQRILRIERAIAKRIGVPSGLVILNLESVKNPTYRPPAYRMEVEVLPKDIMLKREDGQNVSFQATSEIFAGVELERDYLAVYCPLKVRVNQRSGDMAKVRMTLISELRSFYDGLNR